MKKIKYLSLLLLVLLMGTGGSSVFAETGKTYVGYCDGKIATSSSGTITGLTGNNAVIAEAIRLPKSLLAGYKGMTISAVNCGMVETASLPMELTSWVRTSQNGTNVASGTSTSIHSGWNEIALSNAYTITGEEEELWIGFEFVQQKKMSVISFADETNADGCWLGKNDNFTDYSSKQYGSLSVEAVIEGSQLLTHDLSIVSARAQKSLVHLDQPVTLFLTIVNNASAYAVNPEVTCSIGGKQVGTVAYQGTLEQRETQSLNMTIEPSVIDEALGSDAKEGTLLFDMQLSWSDGSIDQNPDDNKANITVTRSETFYTRRMVVEEGTGAWCGWCVKGIVALQYMRENYPDRFIGIAVHNGDDYEVPDYKSFLNNYFDSYPNSIINREGTVVSPSVEDYENYMTSKDAETDCDMQLTAILQEGQIIAHVSTTFLSTQQQNNYRMAFVLCEDQLPIKQKNYYAGGSNGVMGGFENQPSVVEMNVDDVARGIFPSPDGMENCLPEVINRLETYTTDYTFKSPEYLNADNLWLAVLLIDGDSNEIVQALKTNVTSTDGISELRSNSESHEKIYNLQGQHIFQPKHGQIYIQDGKKRIYLIQ